MKSTKKLLALLLSAILLLSLLPAAFASEVGGAGTTGGEATSSTAQKFRLTITDTYPKHVFELYQVFTGTLHTETTQTGTSTTTTRYLSDIKFGSAWTDTTDKDISTIVKEFEANAADPAANWDLLVDRNGAAPANCGTQTCADSATSVTFSNLDAGYYIAREVTPLQDMDDGVTYSSVIVQVVEDANVASKHGTASSQKKVMDTNDSTGDTTGWQDSADYDIGDMVPFQLTAVVGSDYAKYTKERGYSLTFHDHESKGLTFDSATVKAYVVNGNGAPVVIDPAQYTVSTPTDREDGSHDFTIKFTNLKNIEAVQAGSKIVVEYKSQLNSGAEIGSKGNPNEMYIKFSNNPNSDQSEEGGKTPPDKVIVFTFQLDVFKFDGSNGDIGMAGAEFTLYKMDTTGNFAFYKVIKPKEANDDGTGIQYAYHFKGLDDGTYVLKETVTPKGYNTADPIEFTITADHDVTSDDPRLTKLSGDATEGTIQLKLVSLESGRFTTSVLNYKGNTLPSTGGMGTTIFYVLGSILAVGAAILLVSKKRMNSAR